MYKYIKDPIYEESLKFNKNQIKLIDNRIFKRLKNIKQLGSLYEVFPGACHTRAEHSLGVAYLSEKFLNKLEFNSNIKMDDKLVNNIKIAGLFHDVGHGPFSHVFDNHVLSKLCPNSKYRHHEIRSIMLLENILTECNFQNMTGALTTTRRPEPASRACTRRQRLSAPTAQTSTRSWRRCVRRWALTDARTS